MTRCCWYCNSHCTQFWRVITIKKTTKHELCSNLHDMVTHGRSFERRKREHHRNAIVFLQKGRIVSRNFPSAKLTPQYTYIPVQYCSIVFCHFFSIRIFSFFCIVGGPYCSRHGTNSWRYHCWKSTQTRSSVSYYGTFCYFFSSSLINVTSILVV